MKHRNEEEEMEAEQRRRGEPWAPFPSWNQRIFYTVYRLVLIFGLFVLLSFRQEVRVELKRPKDFWVACGFLEVRAV